MAIFPIPTSEASKHLERDQEEVLKYLKMVEELLGPFPEGDPSPWDGNISAFCQQQSVQALLKAARLLVERLILHTRTISHETLEMEKRLCRLERPDDHEEFWHPKLRLCHNPCWTIEDARKAMAELAEKDPKAAAMTFEELQLEKKKIRMQREREKKVQGK